MDRLLLWRIVPGLFVSEQPLSLIGGAHDHQGLLVLRGEQGISVALLCAFLNIHCLVLDLFDLAAGFR